MKKVKNRKNIKVLLNELDVADWNSEIISDDQVLNEGTLKERRINGEEYWQIQMVLMLKNKFELTNKQLIELFNIPKDRLRDRLKIAKQDYETIPDLINDIHEEMEDIYG